MGKMKSPTKTSQRLMNCSLTLNHLQKYWQSKAINTCSDQLTMRTWYRVNLFDSSEDAWRVDYIPKRCDCQSWPESDRLLKSLWTIIINFACFALLVKILCYRPFNLSIRVCRWIIMSFVQIFYFIFHNTVALSVYDKIGNTTYHN